jgi:hypothetical protein
MADLFFVQKVVIVGANLGKCQGISHDFASSRSLPVKNVARRGCARLMRAKKVIDQGTTCGANF